MRLLTNSNFVCSAWDLRFTIIEMQDDGILVLPSIPQPPSKLNSKEVLSEDYQTRFFSLLAIASMSGCCQV